jgi:O-antigen/teichoic acid export membrane protein
MGRPERRWLRELAQYGRYTMGSSLGSVLLQRLDVLMLGYLMGPAAVALYNIGTKLTNYLEIPLRAVTLVIFPQLSQVFQREGATALARFWERSATQLLALVIPPCLLLWLLASPAIDLMAGPGYSDAAPVLQVFLLTALLKPWGRLAGISLDAIGHPRLNFRLVWLSMLLNGSLNWLCIPWLGVMGAAWATVLSMAVTTGLGLWILRQRVPLRISASLLGLPQVYQQQCAKWQHKLGFRRAN